MSLLKEWICECIRLTNSESHVIISTVQLCYNTQQLRLFSRAHHIIHQYGQVRNIGSSSGHYYVTLSCCVWYHSCTVEIITCDSELVNLMHSQIHSFNKLTFHIHSLYFSATISTLAYLCQSSLAVCIPL